MKSFSPSRGALSKVDLPKSFRDDGGRIYWEIESSHPAAKRWSDAGESGTFYGVKLDEPEDATDTMDEAIYFAEVGDEINLRPYLDPDRVEKTALALSYPGRPKRGARSAYVVLEVSNARDYNSREKLTEKKPPTMEADDDNGMDLDDTSVPQPKAVPKSRGKVPSSKKSRSSRSSEPSSRSSRLYVPDAEMHDEGRLATFQSYDHDTMDATAEGVTVLALDRETAVAMLSEELTKRGLKSYDDHPFTMRELKRQGVFFH